MSSTTGKRGASVKVESRTNNHEGNSKKRLNGTVRDVARSNGTSSSGNNNSGNNNSGNSNSGNSDSGNSALERHPSRREESLRFTVIPAQPGEHVVARQLLAGVLRGPSTSEFQAQLDDPFYEPTDRLLCKVNDYLVGHVRLVKREMRFGSAILPVATLADFLVLPEFRCHGCGSALLNTAEKDMVDDGTMIGMIRTRQPAFFLQRGWCVWTRHCFSTAGVREILSCLIQAREPETEESTHRATRYSIRLWRHIEQASLQELYECNSRNAYGPLVRSDAYWSWLIGRHAFDRIYVAIDGPDKLDLDEASSIVGYAVMAQDRIVELMAAPDHKDAARQLLARACADAIEQDAHYIRLDAPVGDPLHEVVTRAGGECGYHESLNGEVFLAKVLDPPQLCEMLLDQFIQRAKLADVTLPVELGFHIGEAWYTLELRPRMAKLKPGRGCRSYVSCSTSTLSQLLLGHLDVKAAIAAQRIIPSTRVAAELTAALFPKLNLWRPPWDDLVSK